MAQYDRNLAPGQFGQGFLHVLQLFESRYVVVAIDQQTIQHLHTAEHANEKIATARTLLRELGAGISPVDKKSMERIIGDAEYYARILAQDLHPARCDPASPQIIPLQSRPVLILGPDNDTVSRGLQNLKAACDSLGGLIKLPNAIKRKPISNVAAQPFQTAPEANNDTSEPPKPDWDIDALPAYDPKELLHYRRRSRNRYRSMNSLRPPDAFRPEVQHIPGESENERPSFSEPVLDRRELPASTLPQPPYRGAPWMPTLTSMHELEGSTGPMTSMDDRGSDSYTTPGTSAVGSVSWPSSVSGAMEHQRLWSVPDRNG